MVQILDKHDAEKCQVIDHKASQALFNLKIYTLNFLKKCFLKFEI